MLKVPSVTDFSYNAKFNRLVASVNALAGSLDDKIVIPRGLDFGVFRPWMARISLGNDISLLYCANTI